MFADPETIQATSHVSDIHYHRSRVSQVDAELDVGEDRLKDFEESSKSASNAQHNVTSTSTKPDRPASRNHAEDVKMDSQPTGVDTSSSSAGARSER